MTYWMIEMFKVFLAYMFVLFVWPSVVFYKYFANKSLSQRFLICTIGVPIAASTLVIVLGLVHLLYQPIFMTGFYLTFIIQFYRMLDIPEKFFLHVKFLITGSMKFKTFVFQINDWAKKRLGSWIGKWWSQLRPHLLECIFLIVLSCYSMMYFSVGCFEAVSYGFGDIYVHHSWIYGLKQGQIFIKGIYPEGMHCLIYLINAIFGIKIYNILLFLQPIQTSFVLIVAFYLFIREFTYSRFTGIIALILFLTVKVYTVNTVYGMSRLQWTIPQEFGVYLAFCGTVQLIRYLRSEKFMKKQKFFKKLLINEELIWFSLALSGTISVHFYCTGMMFFLCVAVVAANLKEVFSIRRFLSLAAAITYGVLLAVLPMTGAYLEGIPLQGSIDWALGVMNETVAAEITDPDSIIRIVEDVPKIYESGFLSGNIRESLTPLNNVIDATYYYGYIEFYNYEFATVMRNLTAIILGITLIIHVTLSFVKLILRKKQINEKMFDGYFVISFSAALFMICYCAKYLGMVQLFSPSRLCTLEHLLNMVVLIIPIDFLVFLYTRLTKKKEYGFFALALSVGLVYYIVNNDLYHSYLYYEFTRYNSAVTLTDRIINEFPENSYTIVSVVDELYQVNEHGFHEEVLTFMNKVEKEEHYTLPSEYVLIFVEKHPLVYAQFMFFDGPKWLANTDYYRMYDYEDKFDAYTQYPKVNHKIISKEATKEETPGENYGQIAYSGVYNRTILESKLYYWCQEFLKQFPYEAEVYYEDQDFVCYKIKQNKYRLFELSFDYLGS